jgi:hypothetical protein
MEDLGIVVMELPPQWERILSILAPFVGVIAAFMAGIWSERHRTRSKKREQHLLDLRERVLEPLEQTTADLGEFFRTRSCHCIEVEGQGSLLGNGHQPIISAERPLRAIPLQKSAAATQSGNLYNCAKASHFPGIVERYEALESAATGFQAECVCYVEWLATQLAGSLTPSQPPGMTGLPRLRARSLALHIYQLKTGSTTEEVLCIDIAGSQSSTIELPNGFNVTESMSDTDAFQVMTEVKGLLAERKRFSGLCQTADTLKLDATRLVRDLKRASGDGRLHGWCRDTTG